MSRRAAVYQRKGKILIVPVYETAQGGYVNKEPVSVVESGDRCRVGEAVLQALEQYEEGLPMPDWSTYVFVALKAAGVRSLAEFHQGLRSCSIEEGDIEIRVIPYENQGAKKGLIELEEAEFTAPRTEDAKTIGELVRRGLSMAR